MSETLQREGGTRTETLSVSLVGGQVAERVAGVLAEQRIGFERFEMAVAARGNDEVDAVVLCAEGTVAATVNGELAVLRKLIGEIPVVLVCAELRPGELRDALAMGVSGLVIEEHLAACLAPCIGAVGAGQVCVPRRAAPQVEAATLSAREKQILGLVVMGYMNSEIAAQLFVAESTVKSHLSSAFAKLGVRSRNEAVDLIVDPERGLGTGILALGGEPIEARGRS